MKFDPWRFRFNLKFPDTEAWKWLVVPLCTHIAAKASLRELS